MVRKKRLLNLITAMFCFVCLCFACSKVKSYSQHTNEILLDEYCAEAFTGVDHDHEYYFDSATERREKYRLYECCSKCELKSNSAVLKVTGTVVGEKLAWHLDGCTAFMSDIGKNLSDSDFLATYYSVETEGAVSDGTKLESAPSTAGYYYIELEGVESKAEVKGVILVRAFTIKNKVTVTLSNWTFGETPTKFTITSESTIPEDAKYYYKVEDEIEKTEFNINDLSTYPTIPAHYFFIMEDSLNTLQSQENDFYINKAPVTEPEKDNRTFIYNEMVQTYNVLSNNGLYTITGNKQRLAGNYKVTITLKNPDCYTWSKTTKSYLEYDFVIEKRKVEIPAADTRRYVYSGNPITYQIANSSYYSVSNSAIQVEAGRYDVIVTLLDKNNTQWTDGTTEDLIYSFNINRSSVIVNANSDSNDDKIVSIVEMSGDGLPSDVNLIANSYTKRNSTKLKNVKNLLSSKIQNLDRVFEVYEIGLERNGTTYNYDGSMSIKIQVPKSLIETKFRLYHIFVNESGDNVIEEVDYVGITEDGCFALQVENLGDFAFVYEQESLTGVIITLSILDGVFIAFLAFQLYWFLKKRGKKTKKAQKTTLALAPVFFVHSQVVAVVILSILMMFALAGDIVLFIFNYKIFKKEQINAKPKVSKESKKEESKAIDMAKKENSKPLEEKKKSTTKAVKKSQKKSNKSDEIQTKKKN